MDYLLKPRRNNKRQFWVHLTITILVIISLFILVNRYRMIQTNGFIKKNLEKELFERNSKLNSIIEEVFENNLANERIQLIEHAYDLDKISAMIYLFKYDSLMYWSSNLIDLSSIQNLENGPVVLLNNGWYKIKRYERDGFSIFGLLLLKNEFAYSNDYLVPEFVGEVALSENSEISLIPGELNINDENGVFLFSIDRRKTGELNSKNALILFIFYQLSIVLILSLIVKFYKSFSHTIRRKKLIPYFIIIDYVILWVFLKYIGIPAIIFESYLFAPATFADFTHRSIGDLFTTSSFILFSIYSLLSFSNRDKESVISDKLKTIAWFFILGILFLSSLIIYEIGIVSLFQNSKISIEFGQDFVSYQAVTIITFIIAASLSLTLYFVGSYVFSNFYSRITQRKDQYLCALIIILVYAGFHIFFGELRTEAIIFLTILSFAFIIVENTEKRITTIHIISFLLIFALYLGFLSSQLLQEKELDQRRVIVETIANDRDPIAEFEFEEAIKKILSDSIISSRVSDLENTNAAYFIINRIQEYFSDNVNTIKYVPFVTICDTSTYLNDRFDSYAIKCVDYFENIINDIGINTNHPDLFFINNYSINNSYIIRLKFPSNNSKPDRFIVIELGSELIPEGLGYPELLIDESSNISGIELISYSFAKYMDGELVYNFGDYFYSLKLKNYEALSQGQTSFNNNEYSHILVKKDNNTSYIISKENKDLIETIAPYSYFFIFLALYLVMFYLITNFSYKIFTVQISFRNRLQYTLLSIILTSFVVIGVTTMLYLVRLNDKKNHQILSEKAHSVLIELEHKLAGEEKLNPALYETLNTWLVKFSLVFFSDINLYSTDGKLIASSRLQIFDEGLLSRLMNVNAYHVLANKEKLQFIQNEKIGNYEYLSAYVPLRDIENQLVAYLNLPYFARQTELQIEITTFLVALVNIYVLFFVIAVMVTILISRRISKPLQLIRQSISGIRLGKANEKINWTRQDEIGSLITEYNRMIDELSKSALLLVRSEREGAWREMAKQVAHEIKNPLTPMKLSVQYLKKAWDENEENWDQRLARFTKTIIEQIDSLSEIANAFSDFAKMPVQKTEQVDLKHIINNSLELFKENTSIKYVLYLPEDEYIVKADKNQMLRAFNNLIKNSIQAIGSSKDGQITISVKKSQTELIVVFADNGSGIPKDMAEKIFSPSFTTKSSGMGLGLAIVKNIVLNAGGNIWFESKASVGTTFYISIPKG